MTSNMSHQASSVPAHLSHDGQHIGQGKRRNSENLTQRPCVLVHHERMRRQSLTSSAPAQSKHIRDNYSLCFPQQSLHDRSKLRHHLRLDLTCDFIDTRHAIPFCWLAWTILFRQYANTDLVHTALIPAHFSTAKLFPDTDTVEHCSKHIQLGFQPSTTILDALEVFQHGIAGWNPYENSDLYQVLLSSESLDLQNAACVRTIPISFLCPTVPAFTQITVSFDFDFIDERQCRRLLDQFHVVFRELLHQPAELCICTIRPTSRRDLEELRHWNGRVPRQRQMCVADAIALQSGKHPTLQAIRAWDGTFTYGQLDALSSKLAIALIQRGVTTETVVPICFEKSAYAIIALLAVCKAGGTFLLVDPTQPFSRLKSIIEQVDAMFCLVSPDQDIAWQSSEMSSYDTFVVSASLIDRLPEERQLDTPTIEPHHACYVMFTSGSTGRPKGVVIEHRSIVTFSYEWQRCLRLHTEPTQTQLLLFASFAFDAVIQEIVVSLIAGACIHIPSEDDRNNDLVGTINRQGVDHITLTPSVLKTLSPRQLSGLKDIIVVGEPLTSALIDEWADRVHLVCGYGPTECTVGSVCNTHVTRDTHFSNIGRPIGCVGWVVDPEDANVLLPIGAVGELLIEGPNVARGYLNDVAKTESVFIQDTAWMKHFRVGKGNRLYKTGDLVRYASDGSLLFVGRKDTQVKIRGQRVELSEVELQLCQAHGDIRSVVADVIVPARSKHPILVAFITFQTSQVLSDAEFQFLAAKIQQNVAKNVPKYMVPSAILQLPSLPLSTSGKTDRKALRQMASAKSLSELLSGYLRNSTVSDLSPRVTLMQSLWSHLLGLDGHSIPHDVSFFQLGGDSIQAILLSQKARASGWNLPVTEIFKYPRLVDMAPIMTPVKPVKEREERGPLETLVDTDHSRETGPHDLPASITQVTDCQEEAIVQAILPSRGQLVYFSLKLHGRLNVDKLRQACQSLPCQHEILRTTFALRQGRIWQTVQKQFEPSFEVHLREESKNEDDMLHDLCKTDSRGCDLLGGPTLKFILLQHHSDYHKLIIRLSHATFDGTSMERIRIDICNKYLGKECTPCPQFRDYQKAVCLLRTGDGYHYWRELLKGASMTQVVVHSKPDYVHPANCLLARTTAIQPIQIDSTVITPATVVKAAWALVLAQLADQQDVIFGYLGSGRSVPVPGINDIVGQCLTDVPIRVKFQSVLTIGDLLLSVHTQYLQSLPYETIGLPEVVRRCTDWPRWTRASSFVQFQNVTVKDTFDIGPDVSCEESKYEAAWDAADLHILVTPQHEHFDVELTFSNDIVPESTGRVALDRFCENIRCLQNPDSDLKELLRVCKEGVLFPVPSTSSCRSSHSSSPPTVSMAQSSIPHDTLQTLQTQLHRAWSEALGPDFSPTTTLPDLDQNFFDTGGDFPRLVFLMTSLKRQEFEVSVEGLIERPTFGAHLSLLVTCQMTALSSTQVQAEGEGDIA